MRRDAEGDVAQAFFHEGRQASLRGSRNAPVQLSVTPGHVHLTTPPGKS